MSWVPSEIIVIAENLILRVNYVIQIANFLQVLNIHVTKNILMQIKSQAHDDKYFNAVKKLFISNK